MVMKRYRVILEFDMTDFDMEEFSNREAKLANGATLDWVTMFVCITFL